MYIIHSYVCHIDHIFKVINSNKLIISNKAETNNITLHITCSYVAKNTNSYMKDECSYNICPLIHTKHSKFHNYLKFCELSKALSLRMLFCGFLSSVTFGLVMMPLGRIAT